MQQASPAHHKFTCWLKHISDAVLLISLLFGSTAGFAQIKKGEKLFQEGRYEEAIRPLRKDFYSEEGSIPAGILLAKCFYRLQEYQEALDVIYTVGENEIQSAADRRFFADVLIANDNFQEAYLNLYRQLDADEKDPKNILWTKKISDLLNWDTIHTGSTLRNLQGLNTIYNEYAPYASDTGELWYVSDISTIQTVFPMSYNNQNMHLYYSTKAKEKNGFQIERPQRLMKKKAYYYHDGPLDKWPEQDKYALTLRGIDTPEGKIGIYFSTLSGKEEDLDPFAYNQTSSCGHPTFTENGLRMMFASDRPGGYGQMDLWYCDWENGQWQAPVNLGPRVNTPFNEVFPNLVEERLYFSSDRRDMGYGGLDIYYTNILNDYQDLLNLRAPINTAHDDFGITFFDRRSGYLASNRKKGSGGDDIYRFSFYPEQELLDDITLQIVSTSLPLGTLMKVYNMDGDVVGEGKSNEKGQIFVSNLKSREVYILKIEDAELAKDAELLAFSKNGKKLGSYSQSKDGEFRFELLPFEDYELEVVENVDESELQFELDGQLVAGDGTSVKSIDIYVKDVSGALLATSKTDKNGRFSIDGMKPNENYVIETSGIDTYHEIDIYGKSGALSHSIKPLGKNQFSYTRATPVGLLQGERAVAENVFAIIPNGETTAETVIVLYDEANIFLKDPSSDEDGFISMGSLIAGKAYRLNIPNKTLTSDQWLVLLDSNGDTSQTVRPFDDKNYFFEYMRYIDYGAELSDNTKEEVFRVKIDRSGISENTPFVLSYKTGEIIDTVYSLAEGELLLKNLDLDTEYELSLVDSKFSEEKRMRVYNEENSVVFQGISTDRSTFTIELLKIESYVLRKEINDDFSILRMGLAGRIVNFDGKKSILQISDGKGKFLAEINTDEKGSFFVSELRPYQSLKIQSDMSMKMKILRIAKTGGVDSLDIERHTDGNFYINVDGATKETIALVSNNSSLLIDADSKFELKEVYYDFNSYALNERSRESLDKLHNILMQNQNVNIEIHSFTDARGPSNYNQMLSHKRAGTVKEYLQRKGIAGDRITAIGKGESDPTNKCRDGVSCTEAEHAANRRTEFILSDTH